MLGAQSDYRAISARKLAEQRSKIPDAWTIPPESYHNATRVIDVPATCGVLSDIECDITSLYDATALLAKLRDGAFSAEQVTVAFCKRAAVAHQLVWNLAQARVYYSRYSQTSLIIHITAALQKAHLLTQAYRLTA
jgi:hypothetical protein